MSFVRSLDKRQMDALLGEKNSALFDCLKDDILNGVVFPAVRKNAIDFYYAGGCLYRFSDGRFTRDKAYEKYGCASEDSSLYQTAKRQVENKFTDPEGKDKERRLLQALYGHTYGRDRRCETVVLDIEVNLNGSVACGKKCDLVFYNVPLGALLFVEGKVFADKRVNVKCGGLPAVIEQVQTYSEAIAEQEQTILCQYKEHVAIVNRLFGTEYPAPTKLIRPAKLLVYETPLNPTDHNRYSRNTITAAVGEHNVIWLAEHERPSTDEIWKGLCK